MHIPVLLNKTIELLDPKPGEFFIDGTFGSGGHSRLLLEKVKPTGRILAIDLDESNFQKFMIQDSCFMIHAGNYADLPEILKERNSGKADGLLLDLGMSSEQIEKSGRGFSFKKDEPLDMRYWVDSDHDHDNDRIITAAEIVNTFGEEALAEIFKKYGEERYARQIAKKIIEQRKRGRIIKTSKLSKIAEEVYGKRSKIHPATRIFQALRIYVNHELENLEKVLNKLPLVLKSKGRVAIISFHSLEDRIVKNKFKEMSDKNILKILTKKPITPDAEEIKNNPRSRSAKLRAAQII